VYPNLNSDAKSESNSREANLVRDNNSGYLTNRIIHSSRIAINNPGTNEKELIWAAGDPYSRTAIVILQALRKFENCRKELSIGQEECGLNFVKCILADFGGFEYQEARYKADRLLFQLNMKPEERKEEYYQNLACSKHSFDKKSEQGKIDNTRITYDKPH
jgi:hypothetical protein